MKSIFKTLIAVTLTGVLIGCSSTQPPKEYDYAAFKNSDPHSILVLPPINNTPEVDAGNAIFSAVTYPIAESGYYVIPVSLVDQTLKQNGILTASDAQNISAQRLNKIFGADAILYLTIDDYGTSYQVIDSVTSVTIHGTLKDSKTGDVIWKGNHTLSSSTRDSNSGLGGALVSAILNQVISVSTDKSYGVGRQASNNLLDASHKNNILYGPSSSNYWKNIQK